MVEDAHGAVVYPTDPFQDAALIDGTYLLKHYPREQAQLPFPQTDGYVSGKSSCLFLARDTGDNDGSASLICLVVLNHDHWTDSCLFMPNTAGQVGSIDFTAFDGHGNASAIDVSTQGDYTQIVILTRGC